MNDRLAAVGSTLVTYASDGVSVDVPAVIGSTLFQLDNGNGVLIAAESRDFLILTADLTIAGEYVEPSPGDRITENGVIYQVADFGSEVCWRWSDPYRKRRRIHTKQVKA